MLEIKEIDVMPESDESWFWGLIDQCIRSKGGHPESPLELLEFLRPGEENRCRRVLERLTLELTSDVLSHIEYERQKAERGLDSVDRGGIELAARQVVLEGVGEFHEAKQEPLKVLSFVGSPLTPPPDRVRLEVQKWNQVEAGLHLIHPSLARRLVEQDICEQADLESASYWM